MLDQPPPNEPRVLIDAEIEVRQGQHVPVLAQPSTYRLIILNSTVLNQLDIGQTITLQLPEREPQQVVIETIDRSSLIARYSVPGQAAG
jgi:hypothetical protein